MQIKLSKLSILLTFIFSAGVGLSENFKDRMQCVEFLQSISGESSEQLQKIFEDEKEIKRFFKHQAVKLHPDKCKNETKEDAERCSQTYVQFDSCVDMLKRPEFKKHAPQEKGTGIVVCQGVPKAICEQNLDHCVWDNIGAYCLSRTLSFCSSAQEKESCDHIIGCKWDQTNKCLSVLQSFCKDATSSDTCKALEKPSLRRNACVWDSKTSSCLDVKKDRCDSATENTSCSAIEGCVWDAKNDACLSKKYSWCSWAGDKHSCMGLGCHWDGNACSRK